MANGKRHIRNKSGFKGVSFYPGSSQKPWKAQIKKNGKVIGLGYYPTPEEAHEAYRGAAQRLHGEYARME